LSRTGKKIAVTFRHKDEINVIDTKTWKRLYTIFESVCTYKVGWSSEDRYLIVFPHIRPCLISIYDGHSGKRIISENTFFDSYCHQFIIKDDVVFFHSSSGIKSFDLRVMKLSSTFGHAYNKFEVFSDLDGFVSINGDKYVYSSIVSNRYSKRLTLTQKLYLYSIRMESTGTGFVQVGGRRIREYLDICSKAWTLPFFAPKPAACSL
jgi:hypothetical protein